jgi:glucosamine 6-phosphate synthetase-like amidotransferase/phosphosugar isomerase protein
LKDALKIIVETKILGTYRISAIELNDPKQIYFVKNSGEFIIGQNKDKTNIIVTSDQSVFRDLDSGFEKIDIPNNHILAVDASSCSLSFEKLEKKIKIERNSTSQFDHIMLEEIHGSIDAVDQATDLGSKFISNHQVVLGGFEKAQTELVHIQDLLISAKGTSYIAAQYGAYIFRELGVFDVVRVENLDQTLYTTLDLKPIKYGGFLTMSQSGSDPALLEAIKLAYEHDFTCFNIVNVENSPITQVID